MKRFVFLILISLCGPAFGTSRLPVVEHFSYSTGNLGTVGSGGNWSGSTTANTIAAGSLDGMALGLAASSGNMVGMGSGNSTTYNLFASASGDIASGKIFCSFLIKVNDATSVSSSGENAISVGVQNSSSPKYIELWFKNVSGAVQLGLAKNGGTPVYITSGPGSSLASGIVHLVVASHEFIAAGSSDDIVKLWVNPGSLGTASEDANAKIMINSGADVTSSAGAGRFIFSGGVVCNIDELRLTATWAEATAPAVPPAPPVTAPMFTRSLRLGPKVILSGTNGPTNGVYTLLTSTNLALPLAQWTSFPSGNFDGAGNFSCTNLAGSSPAQFYRLLVGNLANGAPYILTEPKSVEVPTNQNATFMSVAGGAAPLAYQWYFNGSNALNFGVAASLTVTNVKPTNVGGYSVVVSNNVGSVTSTVAQLTIIVPPTNGDIFVSPTGDDNNPGTLAQPFFNLARAISLAAPGNVIYLRGGTYFYNETIHVDAPGSPTNLTKVWNYPGEHPTLDFTNQPYASANRALYLTTNANCWHFKGLEIANAGDNGMKIEGSSNIIEQCVFHHCGDTGLQIGFAHETVNPGNLGAYNYVLNCDSHDNFDFDNAGSDSDGFACKLHPGYGNVFSGCRSWNNADDGWDLFESDHTITITNCWQWHSGDKTLFDAIYLAKMGHAMSSFQGNGNGFKLGGNGAGGSSEGTHVVRNCVGFNNHFPGRTAHGFDQNSHHGGVVVYNCVSFGNLYNYFFEDAASSGNPQIFQNDVSFAPSGSGSGVSDFGSGSIVDHNSWQLAVTANAGDFMDITEAAAAAPRQADGSLPLGFARLVSGSDLIDKGTDVGIPWNGAAPDLGAFEF
ncbi:MAG TPA: right-handed parallel beta-helix repeat-containing protein [Candidatus Dormibacteraeota bacterium]|nr:right-handed parallel beta-helix repeat-containing protein [Candidatus Dormibacteraeota bacterium]